jgi:hypothetical protein
MIIRIRIAHWRFTWTFAPVNDVVGVNSLLPDGNHILLWDFDDVSLCSVSWILKMVQEDFELPCIRILNTGTRNHYIAYCFKRCSWWNTRRIIASTPSICSNFYKWGIFRKRFTLRVTPKSGRKPHLVRVLPSKIEEDVAITELQSWVKYETLPADYVKTRHEINVTQTHRRII